MLVHAHPFWTMQTPVGWATKAFKNKALVKGTKAFKADPGRIKAPRLQSYASEAATLLPEAATLQPYVAAAATLCASKPPWPRPMHVSNSAHPHTDPVARAQGLRLRVP